MAYIGNNNVTQGFIPAVDYFNGDGATVAFTLSRPVASVAQVQAVIENVPQAPGDAFTVSANTITFTSAPPLGTGNIYVYYTSPITQVIQPSQGTVGVTQLSATGTPSSSTFLRGDNTWEAAGGFSNMQVFTSSGTFTVPSGITKVKVTVVGGGGSGGRATTYIDCAGGGGGGAAIEIISGLTPGSTVAVTVGAGGAGSANNGNAGGTSSFGAYCSATGGSGGTGGDAYASTGGAGGIGSGGNLNIQGGAGGAGYQYGSYGLAGNGGNSILGGGGAGILGTSGTGTAGGAYGGGGAGSLNASGISPAGAAGVVIVEY